MRTMTDKETGILNALVTFAAENIPGGLSEDEREVARIVGDWTLRGNVEPILDVNLEDVYGEMTAEQKEVVHFLVGRAIEKERERLQQMMTEVIAARSN